jgi:hypothetical protein
MDLAPFVQVPFSKYFQIVQKPVFSQGFHTIATTHFLPIVFPFGTQKRFSNDFPA